MVIQVINFVDYYLNQRAPAGHESAERPIGTRISGPRDMHRKYLDAMFFIQQFRKPNLFITMICNPGQKEIQDELKENQVL